MSKYYTATRHRRHMLSLESLAILSCRVELDDFEPGDPCPEHEHRQLILAGQSKCPILWGVMIVRMWLNGYQPRLFGRTIVNDLIAKGGISEVSSRRKKAEGKTIDGI